MPATAELLTVEDWLLASRQPEPLRQALFERCDWLDAHSPGAAWISRVPREALAQRLAELETWRAQAADVAELHRRWPLFGVPFAVKDNIHVAGLPTTAACPAFSQVPETSATVVRLLIDAGAVLMGKANLDQFATGLVGTRSPYGAPSSVFSPAHVSGGSSSGSAVLVASGGVPFALGTDTAGSGRVPAGFNHIVGLKPTPGRVSTAGVVPACRSLDCVSIFALDVDDAAQVLTVIEGPDEADAYSAFVPGRFEWPQALRLGLPHAAAPSDAGYAAAWRQACERLQGLGVATVPVPMAALDEVAALLYEGPWVAERHAAIRTLIESQPQALDPTVARVIGRARGFSAVQAFEGQYALQTGRARAAALWQGVDVLMVPTAPDHPTHAQVQADPLGANAALGRYTNFVNLLGWSALALPAGFTAAGLPFGVTFIGPAGADAALVHWGRRWQQAMGQAQGHTLGATGRSPRPRSLPRPAPRAEPTLRLAVVGAHLSGLPLNGQLLERRGVLRQATTTAPCYRLFALPGTTPPKPGLQRVASGGQAIALEVWELPQAELGSLLALIAAPLGLGSIELADGSRVHGFLCEAHALAGALDITEHGGWRRYLASL